jgi:hypothetical protein
MIIGVFDTRVNAYAAIIALNDLGLDPAENEVEEVSATTVASELNEMEQHPESNAPGSVISLGAPTPPPSPDPTLEPGPMGSAYMEGGADGLIGALAGAGIDRDTATRYAQIVEQGGALIVVGNGSSGEGVREALKHAGAQEIHG